MPFVDNSDEDEKYLKSEIALERWKIRELKRIQRLEDERDKFKEEKKEIERRRNLTEEQRLAEDEGRDVGKK